MWNKIYGAVSVLFGVGIIATRFLSDAPTTGADINPPSQSGVLVMGIAVIVLGLYYFFKKPKK